MDVDVLGIKRFEIAVMGLMKQDQYGHDLAGSQRFRPLAMALAIAEEVGLIGGRKLLPEIIDRAEQVESTHGEGSFWWLDWCRNPILPKGSLCV
jgi:hypothetical protein